MRRKEWRSSAGPGAMLPAIRRWRIGSIVACALLTLLGAAASEAVAQGGRWGAGYFPDLPVVTQTGETRRFYSDVIKGRIVVISFIYTRCTDICPLTTARLSQVAEHLEDVLGRSVHFVSISVDPLNDTPEKLATYAAAFHSGPGWLFLTGTLDDIRAINSKLGEQMRRLNDHRNEIILGNDATGEWARNSVFGDIARLVHEIRSMDPQWRNEARRLPTGPIGAVGHALPSVPGQALFSRLCAACHGFGTGDRVGPDLGGATARRSHEWLRQFIMSPERLRAANDPVALALAKRYPAVRMPNLGLSVNDAADLVAYIEARSAEARN